MTLARLSSPRLQQADDDPTQRQRKTKTKTNQVYCPGMLQLENRSANLFGAMVISRRAFQTQRASTARQLVAAFSDS